MLLLILTSHANIPVDAIDEAMRLNADDFVPFWHKPESIEIEGAHDGLNSTPANRSSRLTFWPLLQQSQK